jgi:hypothetical protein
MSPESVLISKFYFSLHLEKAFTYKMRNLRCNLRRLRGASEHEFHSNISRNKKMQAAGNEAETKAVRSHFDILFNS